MCVFVFAGGDVDCSQTSASPLVYDDAKTGPRGFKTQSDHRTKMTHDESQINMYFNCLALRYRFIRFAMHLARKACNSRGLKGVKFRHFFNMIAPFGGVAAGCQGASITEAKNVMTCLVAL